jgi:adenylate cyclase
MPFRLQSTESTYGYALPETASVVVGRAPTSDFPIIDPTISRRHAQILRQEDRILLRDLGSSNGTYVNGVRVESAELKPGDLVTFGKVMFRLEEVDRRATPARPSEPTTGATTTGSTIVRQRSVLDAQALVADDKSRRTLATLLEVSKGLGKTTDTDALLDKIVGYAYQILAVDRVAILLLDEHDELVSKIARDRRGGGDGDSARAVPQSIARTALNDRVAILTDNAGEDTRFSGQSIVMQQIRSAICVPLMGSERPLGVLYVDHAGDARDFADEDFDLCIAFAGIAAVAIENSQFSQRIQRQMLARSNFERFFTPQLAKRIADSAETVRLGGDKRTVAVLFSDVRGFTALAESMRPEEIASLLTEYFTEMVDCVFRNEGALDKFMGDEIMAQWGAPIGTDDDADHAMKAAIEMLRELQFLNEGWRAKGRPELQVGIGLSYGEVFAGNIGSEQRLEFTVIGDTVNIANRLCSNAGPGEILVSDEFRRALKHPPALEQCPPMELKNKSQPVTVYRVAPS